MGEYFTRHSRKLSIFCVVACVVILPRTSDYRQWLRLGQGYGQRGGEARQVLVLKNTPSRGKLCKYISDLLDDPP